MNQSFRTPSPDNTPLVPASAVPKQHCSKNTTRDQRLQAQTLYYTAGWTEAQIALQLNINPTQVQYAIAHRPTPQKQRTGAKLRFDTPQRKAIVNWVTSSKATRAIPWCDIPSILHLQCGEKAIRHALRKEGYVRGTARRKPPLSPKQIHDRLEWAWAHWLWTNDQWDNILWSDESWVQPGRHTKQWVTRKKGLSELHNSDCVTDRYQRKIGWMFWGGISGKYGCHEGLFWEKEWKSINTKYVRSLYSYTYIFTNSFII